MEVTDSTIAPPKTIDFLSRTFRGCSIRGRMTIEKYIFTYFLVREGLSTDGQRRGGKERAPYFRRYGLGLVSEPAISFKKSWGGYREMTQVRYYHVP